LRPNNKLGNRHVEITTGNRDIYSCININILANKISYFPVDDKLYCEINPELFKLLLKYRDFSETDSIYKSFNLRYSDEYSNTKKIILCSNDKNEYCIFTNRDIISYTYDKIIKSDLEAMIEGKLIKCLVKTKLS
jgi:hypothetical protein